MNSAAWVLVIDASKPARQRQDFTEDWLFFEIAFTQQFVRDHKEVLAVRSKLPHGNRFLLEAVLTPVNGCSHHDHHYQHYSLRPRQAETE
ncbi:hypothetical protein [Streptomyces sp. NPDC057686]|uniref:hypothetical protein n=1 Tax=Streptomyces sp. NPDC057686 TaxID=3346212 RepID=UPI0036C9FC28